MAASHRIGLGILRETPCFPFVGPWLYQLGHGRLRRDMLCAHDCIWHKIYNACEAPHFQRFSRLFQNEWQMKMGQPQFGLGCGSKRFHLVDFRNENILNQWSLKLFLPKHRFIFLTDTGPFAQECPSGADVVFPIQEITLKGLGDPIITCDRWDCFHPPPFTIEPSGAQSLLRSSDWSQTFRPLLKRWPVGNVWCWSSWKYNYRYRL